MGLKQRLFWGLFSVDLWPACCLTVDNAVQITPLQNRNGPFSKDQGSRQDSLRTCFIVQLLSCVWLFPTPWIATLQASLSFTILSLLKLSSIGVGDAIQQCHLLLSPSPAFSLSQHHGLFHWVSSLHQVTKVLELQLQPQSFQWIFNDFL